MHRAGGYTGEYALELCMFNGIFASLSALPIPFLDNFIIVVTLIWFLLFFGGYYYLFLVKIIMSCIASFFLNYIYIYF